METIEVIKIWKEKKITHCEMEFSCGGDSMNDYSFRYFTEDGSFKDGELTDSYFDNEVYRHIDFYVNSDGHYLGEQGIVYIEIDDSGDDFTYSKSAQSEWSESIENELYIQLTDEQVEFIRKNVSNINGGYDEGVNINYSRSFIMTDREEEIQKELELLIEGKTANFEPETDEELQEWYRFESGEFISINENNQLLINMRNEIYLYTDSE